MIRNSRLFIRVSAAIFLALLLIFIVVSSVLLSKSCYAEYIIVFDAGSTGTRGLLYEPQNGVMVPTSRVKCEDNGIVQVLSPQSTYNSSLFSKCLKQLMKNNVKAKYHTVLLRATGGMRELCRRDGKSCNSTLEALTSAAATLGFPIKSEYFQILTGEKEAYYLLRQATIAYQNNTSNIAVMDLGGVSLQVAHEKIEKSYTSESRKKDRMNSNSEMHPHYTFSSDCLGTTVTSMKTERTLINQALTSTPLLQIVNHPCYPTPFTYAYKPSSGFVECHLPELTVSVNSLVFAGAFNLEQCNSLFGLNGCAECKKWDLTELLKQPTYNLYAVGAYSKSVSEIPGNGDVRFSDYKTYVETFCASALSIGVSDIKAKIYCGGMMYSVKLIEEAGVASNTFIVREDRNIGWINGFVDEYISTHSKCSTYQIIVLSLGIGLLVILLLFVAFYFYKLLRSPNYWIV